ncbi:MAG: FAD-dependent oxidoreductase [Candidatus Marinimicrobia bacterium]|nr:FAD-dependent oxidoreductase [Candidatus Neomarinimicrobiota bacterium]
MRLNHIVIFIKKQIFIPWFIFTILINLSCNSLSKSYDIIVYGGTSAGVMAAVQSAQLGQSVIIIEPGKHLGGLSASGLGATDIGNKDAIGGLSLEFYRRVYAHYNNIPLSDQSMWTFEPHVAENIFNNFISENNIPVIFNERIDLNIDVKKDDGRITEIQMESGKVYRGKMFIDATYEGDLMAKAGVSYTFGRESNDAYGESLNGVQTKHANYHNFKQPVDPYIIPGNSESGLLPGIQNDGGPGLEGSGDHRIQAYCFRMCLTNIPENRIPFPKPDYFNPMRYELLLRYLNTGVFDVLKLSTPMPNGKTDTNNKGGFATDNIGMNYDYPDGDYKTREAIIQEHENYQKGLMWFLANDPRVPKAVQNEVDQWGLPKDEFADNEHWPHQLYIREARRMVSDYVITQHDCQGYNKVEDVVGMAAYNMDSHHVQRYVDDTGQVRNEGDVQVGGFSPYPISYRSIVPKKKDCTNLIVPVCLSASHIAYGSIRMEPVFMVLGQSAATAAAIAIQKNISVQDVNYTTLQSQLIKNHQVLNLHDKYEDHITKWRMSEPFMSSDNNLFNVPYPPELGLYNNWKPVPQLSDPNRFWHVDFAKIIKSMVAAIYIKTEIWSDEKQAVRLEMGSNDGIKAWMNEQLVHENDASRTITAGEDVKEVTLQKGKNVLLMKIINKGGGWGACARIRGLDGKHLTNIRHE